MKKNRIRKMILLGICMLIIAVCGSAVAEEGGLTLEAGRNYRMQKIRHAAHVPTIGNFTTMQGGGSDGKYAYYIMIDGRMNGMIYKYDLETWKYLGHSESMPLGHGNDLSYNSVTNQLIVAYCSINRICFVDPDSLAYLGCESTGLVTPHRLEYLGETEQLLIGSGYTLIFYPSGQYKKADSYFLCGDSRLTTQGLTCDGRYVYDVRFDSDMYGKVGNDAVCNYIIIHDVSGCYIGTVPVYGISGEAENIIALGDGLFAIGCNGSDDVYIVELLEDDLQD